MVILLFAVSNLITVNILHQVLKLTYVENYCETYIL